MAKPAEIWYVKLGYKSHLKVERAMTKADIVERIQANTGLSKKESTDTLEAVFSIIKSTLEAGENIKISGFGNFEVKQKKDRNGRNPHTGETIIITARRVLSFKISTILKRTINNALDS